MENLSVSNSCVNYYNINIDFKCEVHSLIVNEKYTCNNFDLSTNISE